MRILKNILTLYLTLKCSVVFGQDSLQDKVDDLKTITNMPYICRDTINKPDCGQTAFWTVVTEKLDIIPYLLDKLDDTTKTTATVPNFGGKWTVADIAYTAIQEIIKDIPTLDLLGVSIDANECGSCAYWDHLRKGVKNRKNFKVNVTKWYYDNKDKLVWVDSNMFLTCDCGFEHPNGGHYERKK